MSLAKRSLTGIRSSGNLHLGNLLGTIRPALSLQSQYECLYFIADMHSLTTVRDPKALYESIYDVAAAWISFGLDTKKHLLYRQSDLPMVTELAWYLSCVTGVGLLEKAHAYKDAQSAQRDANHGVFAYPVLMAADILLYAPDIVPVGKDQKQHVEMARDMAGSFNALYGDVLKLPEPRIDERVMTIPGLDGRKMSKSYGNEIALFAEPAALRKRVMSIVTDSTPVEAPKTAKGSLLGELYALFASPAECDALEKKLQTGGFGWGHAKEELFECLDRALTPARQKFNELRPDLAALRAILKDGAERAHAIGDPILKRVREAVGIRS